MLKDGSSGFGAWRKTFDLQVRAVWAGLDQVLESMRATGKDACGQVTREVYERLLLESAVKPLGASDLDWDYTHISSKLYMVLHSHCDVDPTKVIEESTERCGFEAYRLLNKAYDVYTIETETQLINHMLQLGQWSVKGIVQAESLMREAKARINA